jgi:hypothetical protein
MEMTRDAAQYNGPDAVEIDDLSGGIIERDTPHLAHGLHLTSAGVQVLYA